MKQQRFRIVFLALTAILSLFIACSDDDASEDPVGYEERSSSSLRGTSSSSVVADLTITTAQELADFAESVNNGNYFNGKLVKLGANIMLNDTTNWRDWANSPPARAWVPIGLTSQNDKGFSGTFDGSGYVISGVYINNSQIRQGLFGVLSLGGTIKNLGVTASYIENKYGDNIGGLVGFNYYGTIINSYFIGTITTGGDYIGGLVGYNSGNISNCYSAGIITVEGNNVGGLVGYHSSGEINNSYYDKDISGQSDIGKGIGKTTAEMKRQTTFAGWDFNRTWGISNAINNGYPYLLGGSAGGEGSYCYGYTNDNGYSYKDCNLVGGKWILDAQDCFSGGGNIVNIDYCNEHGIGIDDTPSDWPSSSGSAKF